MRPLKKLTFDAFRDELATTFAQIADGRDPQRITWEMPAVLMSAFAMLFFQRRCFRAVDSMSEGPPKLIAIDEEADHQIVHSYRLGKTNRATYEPLDPSPQIKVFALDGLRVLFTDDVLLRNEMPLIRSPSIGVKARDPKRLKQFFELQKSIFSISPGKIGKL